MKTNEDLDIRQPRTAFRQQITLMTALVRCFAVWWLLVGLFWVAHTTVAGAAATAEEPATLVTQDLRLWAEQVPIPGSQLQETMLAKQLLADEELHPFSGRSVVGLGITAFVQFKSERSIVRIVMVDDQLHEYLVYEAYPLLASASVFPIRDACRETCLLPPTVPVTLKVELVEASLEIQTILTNQLMTQERMRGERATASVEDLEKMKKAQEMEIIDTLNRQIQAQGLRWRAGETAISRLSYAERKKLLSCTETGRDTEPNLQGAEYYVGGIFEVNPGAITSSLPTGASSSLIDSFDWRNRHGANKPGSPYYDGDATGSGWMTSIKSQRCADCWAHSALGATEAQANLYFNQHLDLNLSEQELVSCSGAGSCQYGGNTGAALSYVVSVGVVDEACFPESGTDEQCGNCCPAPRERIRIARYDAFNPFEGEDSIKRRLIKSGPLPFGISSWWHALVLVGYELEPGTGDTVWILKNSWGESWGEHGYGYVKVPLNDIYLTYNLYSPVISQFTPYTVTCRDADGDGYFNWGISDEPPGSCGKVPPIKDCDDSDPTVALMLENGDCTAPPPLASVAINDVAVAEGNSGTVNAVFSVTLSAAIGLPVTVNFATADGTASSGSDYASNSGVLTFNPGETTKNITVAVNGDTLREANETFFLNLSNGVNATIADGQGLGTITNDDPLPTISISSATVAEGMTGLTSAGFVVVLSSETDQTVTVSYSTTDDTANAGSDYVRTSGILTFSPGTTARTITVLINGDTLPESNETFFVNLSNPVNATIAKAQGVGTILNDDPLPTIAIDDASVIEGNAGTTNILFTLTLDAAIGQTVTVTYRTDDGSATAGTDYASATGTLTLNPGETSKTIAVLVNGDTTVEGNETFFVHLTSVTNAAMGRSEGLGTIINDDFPAPDARLGNISTRSRVLTGDNAMIGGFIIAGSTPMQVLIRSRGPSMSGSPFFVPGTLANPLLRLYSGQTVIAQNDNWQDAPSCTGFVCEGADAIKNIGMDPCEPNPGQAGPPPNCALESAILITLPPGGYTGIVSGADGGTGVALVEVFDADTSTQSDLGNISTRSFVQTGDNIMIGGLIIEASDPKTVLIRARGPSMSGAPFNLTGTLSNPMLQLFSDQTLIAFNDNWHDLQGDEIIATGMDPCLPNPDQVTAPPGCDQESAMVLDLPAGGYTAWLTGVGGQTGIGLVEVFEAPEVIIPNAEGTYRGSILVTLSQCTNPADDSVNNFAAAIALLSQRGSIIVAMGTFGAGPTSGNFNITGTVTAGFDTMGSFTFMQSGASGRGSFTGAGLGNTITLNLTGQATIPGGGTCTLNGSLSGNR